MANPLQNLLGPVAPGVSGVVNPLSMLGAGIYSGDPAGALSQIANIQQAGQQLAAQQAAQEQQMALLEEEAQMERTRFQQQQEERAALQALAPDVAAEMGLPPAFGMAPEMTMGLYGQQLKAAQQAALPSAGMKQFAQFQTMPPEQQQAFLSYQRSMSPFAGMQSYMSPLAGDAASWTNKEGQQPPPSMTPEQAGQAGYYPRPKAATPEVAGKKAAMAVAGETLGSVRDAIVGPEGGVDRTLVTTMALNVPFSEGRLQRARLVDVLQTKLRAETGATANEEEVRNILDRYLPSVRDSDEGIKDKFDRLQRFFTLSIKETNPQLYESLRGRAKPGEEGPKPTPSAALPPGFIED